MHLKLQKGFKLYLRLAKKPFHRLTYSVFCSYTVLCSLMEDTLRPSESIQTMTHTCTYIRTSLTGFKQRPSANALFALQKWQGQAGKWQDMQLTYVRLKEKARFEKFSNEALLWGHMYVQVAMKWCQWTLSQQEFLICARTKGTSNQKCIANSAQLKMGHSEPMQLGLAGIHHMQSMSCKCQPSVCPKLMFCQHPLNYNQD